MTIPLPPSSSHFFTYSRAELTTESESYVTTDGQPASLSWNEAPIWGLRPDFYYRQTIAGLLIWGAQFLDTPFGGGNEYLHRDSASRRRRLKGKS
jgi:hypothetical protein